jgi:hypothetical protein
MAHRKSAQDLGSTGSVISPHRLTTTPPLSRDEIDSKYSYHNISPRNVMEDALEMRLQRRRGRHPL